VTAVGESYGRDGGRWLKDHPGWLLEPPFGSAAGYWAWRPDARFEPVLADTLDELAGKVKEAESMVQE